MLTLVIQSEQGANIRMLTLAIQSEQGTHFRMLTLAMQSEQKHWNVDIRNTIGTRNKH
jgi:hypothetical protein